MKILSEGQYIKHFQYGCGVVTESDAERATMDFDLHGIKKFVTVLMVAEPAQGTPPRRPRGKRGKKAVATVTPTANAGTK